MGAASGCTAMLFNEGFQLLSSISPDILCKLHGTLGLTKSTDATFWAACVIAFSSFRKSNLFLASTSSFDPHKHLRICDIRVCKWS